MCQDKGNVYKSPGEILRDKYNHLSPSERTARMNILAEDNAYRILLQMENSMPRSHFVERHGAQTTLQAQFNRVEPGNKPNHGCNRNTARKSSVTFMRQQGFLRIEIN